MAWKAKERNREKVKRHLRGGKEMERRRQSAVEIRAVLKRWIFRRQTTALSRTTSTLSLRRPFLSPVSDSAISPRNPFPYTFICPPSSVFLLFLQLLDSATKHMNQYTIRKEEEVERIAERALTLRIRSERGRRSSSRGFDSVRLMKKLFRLRLKKLDEGFEFEL